jgi:hypothetical protein
MRSGWTGEIIFQTNVILLLTCDFSDVESKAWSNGGFDSLADGERMLLWHGNSVTISLLQYWLIFYPQVRDQPILLVFSNRACVLRLRKVSVVIGYHLVHILTSHSAPSTGYMFGKGVYFADMMSKVCFVFRELPYINKLVFSSRPIIATLSKSFSLSLHRSVFDQTSTVFLTILVFSFYVK